MLHRDRAERRERRRTGAASARSGTGACARAPTRRRRAGPACPRSSSTRRAGRSRGRGRRGAACAPRRSERPSCAPAAAASSATARACPRVYGDFRSTKFAIASSAASKRSPESTTASAGSASITASQVPTESRSGEDHLRLGAQEPARARGRTACRRACGRAPSPRRLRRPGARPRRTPRAARAAPRAGRPRPSSSPGQPRPSHCSYAPPSASSTPVGQLELLAQRSRHRARAWAIMSSTSRWPGDANSSPTRKRCNGGFPDADPAHRRPPAPARCASSWSYFDGLQRDVVAEPLGLLVRVGVAADVDEQRGVVDDRALVLVEPDALGEPQRDQALPQHVLHRLPEAEVDAERERARPAPPAAPARRRSRSSRAEATPAAGARQARRRKFRMVVDERTCCGRGRPPPPCRTARCARPDRRAPGCCRSARAGDIPHTFAFLTCAAPYFATIPSPGRTSPDS